MKLATVNKAIAARGIAAELVKGDAYYYFIGLDVERAKDSIVLVPRLNDLSLDRWMDLLDEKVQETKTVQENRVQWEPGQTLRLGGGQ